MFQKFDESAGGVVETDQRRDTIRRWVENLRSGRYQQCEGSPRIGDAYCVLGVLVDSIPGSRWFDLNGHYYWEMADASSIYSAADEITGGRDTTTLLYEMNDGTHNQRPHSFMELADFIESRLL